MHYHQMQTSNLMKALREYRSLRSDDFLDARALNVSAILFLYFDSQLKNASQKAAYNFILHLQRKIRPTDNVTKRLKKRKLRKYLRGALWHYFGIESTDALASQLVMKLWPYASPNIHRSLKITVVPGTKKILVRLPWKDLQ
jgi:hypothetical protein